MVDNLFQELNVILPQLDPSCQEVSAFNIVLDYRTWNTSLTEPQKMPSHSGLIWTKMLMTSKNGAKASEKAAILVVQEESLLNCLCSWYSALTAASMSAELPYWQKDRRADSGNCVWNSCRVMVNKAVGSSCTWLSDPWQTLGPGWLLLEEEDVILATIWWSMAVGSSGVCWISRVSSSSCCLCSIRHLGHLIGLCPTLQLLANSWRTRLWDKSMAAR